MKPPLLTILFVLGAALSAPAASIVGHVKAEGKAGAAQDDSGGNYSSRALKFAERVDYDAMKDFVVFIDGPLTNAAGVTNSLTAEVATTKVSQQRATFSPHVLPVTVGTRVQWPNHDDIFHNVFSYSESKPFDLGLYKSDINGKKIPVPEVLFDRPGRVDVFCSIHANMNCVVLVLDNPFFSVTNEKGNYAIQNVPPGSYRLKAWHERLPPQIRQIEVPAAGEIRVDFTLGITGLPRN